MVLWHQRKRDKAEVRLPSQVDPAIAEQLVAKARADGVDLVGPGGLLSELTKQVLETGLEVEMEEHLGYEKHAVEGRDGGNSRNGTRSKKVITEITGSGQERWMNRWKPALNAFAITFEGRLL